MYALFPFNINLGVELLLYGSFIFNFLRNCQTFPQVAALFYNADDNVWAFSFLHILMNICYYLSYL